MWCLGNILLYVFKDGAGISHREKITSREQKVSKGDAEDKGGLMYRERNSMEAKQKPKLRDCTYASPKATMHRAGAAIGQHLQL